MKKSLFFIATVLLTFTVAAQSSDKLTQIIQSQPSTCGQMAYLYCVYSQLLPETATFEEAFSVFQENFPVKDGLTASSPVPLSELSLTFAKLTNLKGGLFYSIFKNRRYAFKELQAKGILPPDADPSDTPSGRNLIAVFNSCLEQQGE